MSGVFGNLFDEDNADGGEITPVTKTGIPQPPRPRGQCQLTGIENQGATCYLNSLIQTLLYTPEFRGIDLLKL